MLRDDVSQLKGVRDELQSLVKRLQWKIKTRRLRDEEDITSQFLAQLEKVFTFENKRLKAHTEAIVFSKHEEEPVSGADLLVLTAYQAETLSISKGFLVQAKLLKHGGRTGGDARKRLHDQCRKMLGTTNESYVWCYSPTSIRVHRAYLVHALKTTRLDDLAYMYLTPFLIDFLKCRYGDTLLSFDDLPRIRDIIEEYRVRYALLISVRGGRDKGPRGGGGIDPGDGPPDFGKIAEYLGGDRVPRTDDDDQLPIEQEMAEDFDRVLQKAASESMTSKVFDGFSWSARARADENEAVKLEVPEKPKPLQLTHEKTLKRDDDGEAGS